MRIRDVIVTESDTSQATSCVAVLDLNKRAGSNIEHLRNVGTWPTMGVFFSFSKGVDATTLGAVRVAKRTFFPSQTESVESREEEHTAFKECENFRRQLF